MDTRRFDSIDQYIAGFPPEVQAKLRELRAVIARNAPLATEKISYQMPTFFQDGNLIHFAAYKNHIGIYPLPTAIAAFAERLSVYKNAKGSVQFPLGEPLPFELIAEIVRFRVAENAAKLAAKTAAKAVGKRK